MSLVSIKKQKKHSDKEYDKQLKDQQDGLNKMTVDEYLAGRKAFDGVTCRSDGTATIDSLLKNRPKRNAEAAREARADHQSQLKQQYEDANHPNPSAAAKADMGTLAALHNPDMVAAGQDIITGFGDKGINSSIGAQWKDRVSSMDNAACREHKAGNGNKKMNVKLKRCKNSKKKKK